MHQLHPATPVGWYCMLHGECTTAVGPFKSRKAAKLYARTVLRAQQMLWDMYSVRQLPNQCKPYAKNPILRGGPDPQYGQHWVVNPNPEMSPWFQGLKDIWRSASTEVVHSTETQPTRELTAAAQRLVAAVYDDPTYHYKSKQHQDRLDAIHDDPTNWVTVQEPLLHGENITWADSYDDPEFSDDDRRNLAAMVAQGQPHYPMYKVLWQYLTGK